jgi:hypothetical protein
MSGTEWVSGLKFELDEQQRAKAAEFIERFAHVYHGAIGGGFTFEFSPTNLGVVAKVVHAKGMPDEETCDLTDYDSW